MKKPSKKPRTIDAVVRDALNRALTGMEEEGGHIHNGWTGRALASWVAPGVTRAVKRHLSLSPPSKHRGR
jgi:hypothetical protein